MPRWVVEAETSVKNVRALPRFQALCEKVGVVPTYLVTWPMLTSAESRAVLCDLARGGRCEVGTHLHPWNTPPLPNGVELEPRRPSEIPPAALVDKLRILTETYQDTFGRSPTSFRAGRFGFNAAVLQALESLGYLVDSSVTSGLSWTNEGGEDFFRAPPWPYCPSRDDVRRPGASPIFEVPVSVGFNRPIPPILQRIYHRLPRWTRLRGLLSTEHAGILDYYWLSPSQRSADELIALADALVADGRPVLNVFFHSSELYPGTSIYSRTDDDVDAYFERLERLFIHALETLDAQANTLTGLRKEWVHEGEGDVP